MTNFPVGVNMIDNLVIEQSQHFIVMNRSNHAEASESQSHHDEMTAFSRQIFNWKRSFRVTSLRLNKNHHAV